MFDVASKKLGLEQALMSGVTKNSKLELSKKELQDLIRRGEYHQQLQGLLLSIADYRCLCSL